MIKKLLLGILGLGTCMGEEPPFDWSAVLTILPGAGQTGGSQILHFKSTDKPYWKDPKAKLFAPFRPFSVLSRLYELKEGLLKEAEKWIEKNGSEAEASAAAGLALLIEMEDRIPRDGRVIFINTGKTKIPN